RAPRVAGDVGGEHPGLPGGVALRPVGRERQPHDDAGHRVLVQQREESPHGETLAGAAGESGERLGEGAGFVGQGEADAALTPVDGEQAPRRHPCAIVWKNSALFFVRLSRSSRNSIASTGGMSARKLRSRYTLFSSSLLRSSSSLRVLVRWTSIAGKVRRSAMRRSRITSELPV